MIGFYLLGKIFDHNYLIICLYYVGCHLNTRIIYRCVIYIYSIHWVILGISVVHKMHPCQLAHQLQELTQANQLGAKEPSVEYETPNAQFSVEPVT